MQNPLVVLIQAQAGMVERLLSAHADDGTGRCRTCSTGGQTGRFRWPCTLFEAAQQAACQSGAATVMTGEAPQRRVRHRTRLDDQGDGHRH